MAPLFAVSYATEFVTVAASATRTAVSKSVPGAQESVVSYFISLWFNFNLFALTLTLMEI